MNDRLVVLNFVVGEVGVTLGDNFIYGNALTDMTIVGVVASPSVDDAGLTVDINDDGTGVITAIACATKATPGTWKSTHLGGTNEPVRVVAASVLSLDANNAAANTTLNVAIWALIDE